MAGGAEFSGGEDGAANRLHPVSAPAIISKKLKVIAVIFVLIGTYLLKITVRRG
jgi:hypothetical protein